MRKLHLYLAMSVGLIFVVLGVTGSVLVFRAELQQQYAPKLSSDYLDLETVGVDVLTSELASNYDNLHIRSVTLPQAPRDHYLFSVRYQQDGKKEFARLFVDPVSGETSPVSNHVNGFEQWVYRLHSSLFLSDPGTTVVGAAGTASLLLLALGIALWWPGRRWLGRALRIPGGVAGRALLSALHRTAGIYLVPLLLLITLSGIMLVFRQVLIAPIETVSTGVSHHPVEVTESCISTPGPEDYIFAAEQLFPDAMATHIKFPVRNTRPVEVTLRHEDEIPSLLGLTRVTLDTNCATVLNFTDGRSLRVSDTLTETVIALHNGSFFGVSGRFIYALLGMVPVFFAVTGLLIWYGKKKAAVRKAYKAG